jgi:hypothetical protein
MQSIPNIMAITCDGEAGAVVGLKGEDLSKLNCLSLTGSEPPLGMLPLIGIFWLKMASSPSVTPWIVTLA